MTRIAKDIIAKDDFIVNIFDYNTDKIFDTDELKKRANNMGINDFDKKYKLNEIVKGDSLFCATGITNGDLVNGVKLRDNKMVVNTLITHKSQNMKKIVTGEIDIKK